MEIKNKMLIMLKAREIIHYFGVFIHREELTSEERNMLYDLVLSATKLSNEIRNTFCDEEFD